MPEIKEISKFSWFFFLSRDIAVFRRMYRIHSFHGHFVVICEFT